MATHEKKQFADLDEAQKLHLRLMAICHISFTEEDKNKYLPKLQNDEFLKNKIEESHRFVINYFEECSKIENFDERSRQIVWEMIAETTIEDYTNEVYEIICRLAILEEVKDDITSLEKFYEESIAMSKIEYISICINRVNSKG